MRRGRLGTVCARGADSAAQRGRSTSPLEAAMEQPEPSLRLASRARRLRIYRLLANSFGPLLAVALLAVVLRWSLPQLTAALVVIWLPVALLLVVLAVPWLVVSLGFASGLIKCPSCDVPLAPHFTLWIPKTCRNCGYDINAALVGATSNNRWRGP